MDEQDAAQEYEERSSDNSEQSSLTWIAWFCSIPGHEYFCEVAEDFIEDDFNLTGLNSMVPFWKEAMEMVLDVEPGACLSIVYLASLHSVQRTRSRSQTYRSSNSRPKCYTVSSINAIS